MAGLSGLSSVAMDPGEVSELSDQPWSRADAEQFVRECAAQLKLTIPSVRWVKGGHFRMTPQSIILGDTLLADPDRLGRVIGHLLGHRGVGTDEQESQSILLPR